MFTVKHQKAAGKTIGKACDSYEKHPPNDAGMPSTTLISKDTKDHIELERGDVVYYENAAGRTVDILRAPK